jgi:hypothetical protein
VRGFICTIDRSREKRSRFLRDARARDIRRRQVGHVEMQSRSRERRGKAAEKQDRFSIIYRRISLIPYGKV